jgi:uncharacterized protein (UPF0371 family)
MLDMAWFSMRMIVRLRCPAGGRGDLASCMIHLYAGTRRGQLISVN